MTGKRHKSETIEKMRKIAIERGNKVIMTPGVRKKISNSHKGRKKSLSHRISMSLARQGEKSHRWKGGISKIHKRIRHSIEFKLWREAVFERDNYTCRFCGWRGGILHPDHIKPFAYFPELRFSIDNGRTLCVDCHKNTDTFGIKANKKYGKA